jgi:hypothetical protein
MAGVAEAEMAASRRLAGYCGGFEFINPIVHSVMARPNYAWANRACRVAMSLARPEVDWNSPEPDKR